MNEFTRRDLLKSLAAAPIASSLAPLEHAFAQARQPKVDLCLWFHGLFAFVIKHDHIVVLTPKVEDHEYLAGLWQQEQKLREGEWYRLSGVSDPARANRWPAVNKEQVPFLSGVNAINMIDSYFLMRLPFPREIIPLRYVKAKFSGKSASKQGESQNVPTVQLMRYRVVDYSNLRLEPFNAWVKQKRPPAIINYHIFAEPKWLVHPEHAIRAFDGMMQMFSGVDLKLMDTSESCFPLDMSVPAGVNAQQQISLAERNGDCKKAPGGRTGNCFMVIIDVRDREGWG